MNGSVQAAASVTETHRGRRATIDPDDYRGGFAVWSGTSFASPVLAGELLMQICASKDKDILDRDTGVARGWAAVAATAKVKRPAAAKPN
jgi:hypothetical protein